MNPEKFTIQPEYISEQSERGLIVLIKSVLSSVRSKNHAGRSRLIRYGFAYEDKEVYIAPIPEWIPQIGNEFDSITLNEYSTGCAISPHTDSNKFGDMVAILSLGASATMRFRSPTKDETFDYFLMPRSLAFMSGELRRVWKHEILPVEKLRYSIVYRERIKQK